MPQLDTSTWFIIITTMLLTLYLIMQLKLLNTYCYLSPSQKILMFNPTTTPGN